MAVADGAAAAQKCLKFLAAGRMPNLLWVGRDRAHAVRIATSGPLLREAHFKSWWDDTFGDKHALVPDIQNSEEWLAKLVLCQKVVLSSSGVQGCDVTAVARTLSFAKQRFDSMAGPQLTYCIILVAIALLLAYQASDRRQTPQNRNRARRRLEEMPGHVLTAGISASYTDEAIRFVRAFDVAAHDPALTYSCKVSFLARMHALFTEGKIFECPEDGDQATPLAIVWKNARESKPIYYDDDGKVLHLYRKPSPASAKASADSIQAITASMTDRVEVELSTDDLGVLFTAFDLGRWHAASCEMQQREDRSKLLVLERHARQMFRGWRLDGGSGVREMTNLAFRLCDVEKTHLDAGKPRDNRVAWAQVLQPGFLHANDSIATMGPMLHIYLAASDSTCGVERDLGALTRVLHAHSGHTDEDGTSISHCTEVLLDGPVSEEGVGFRRGAVEHHCELIPTDFTIECARLWVDLQGRRFRVYQPGRKPGPQKTRGGTWIAARRGVKHALDKVARASDRNLDAPTMLGVPRRMLLRTPAEVNPARAALQKFDALTRTKSKRSMILQLARRQNGANPYTNMGLNPNKTLRTGSAINSAALPTPRWFRCSGDRIVVLDCCTAPLANRDGYTIRRSNASATSHWQFLRSSGIVVADHTWMLDGHGIVSDRTLAVFCAAVALGKPVLGRSHWAACKRHGPPEVSVARHKAAVREGDKERILVISRSLRQECPLFCVVLEQAAKVRGSKWRVQQNLGADATDLNSRDAARRFLISVRRMSQQGAGLLGGGYFATRRPA